jgi:Zn-dependent alcohol dehydrogenase
LCETKVALDKESRLHTKAGHVLHQGLRTAAFAEYVVVEESQVVRIPAEMPLDRASLLACGVITGFGAVVNTAQISPGSTVVVIGAGGVGLNSIQAAYLSGAQVIIAVDLVNSKLKAATVFGASHTINPTEADVAEVVQSLTQGRGVDYVVVTVGSGKAIEQGLGLLRPAGTLVIVGMPASGVKIEIEAVDVAGASQRILGSKMGSARLAVDVPILVDLYQQGRLKLDELITARYPLAEINEAIVAVKRGDALRNVIVF